MIVRRQGQFIGWRSNHHHKKRHTQRPNVGFTRIKRFTLAIHFGCFIVCFTHIFGAHKRVIVVMKKLRQTKIAKFELHFTRQSNAAIPIRLVLVVLDEHVLEANVEMTHVHVAVQPLQELHDLSHQVVNVEVPLFEGDFAFANPSMALHNPIEKITAAILHHQKIIIFVLEETEKLGQRRWRIIRSQIHEQFLLFDNVLLHRQRFAVLVADLAGVQLFVGDLDDDSVGVVAVQRLGLNHNALQRFGNHFELSVAILAQRVVIVVTRLPAQQLLRRLFCIVLVIARTMLKH
mmetsp:Transcript_39303/g.64303  ORF Transcript_39303/g.64303 Transcript_39303/m.64303 type:complete len:290 (+) Transcript_39303:841-1710(+)